MLLPFPALLSLGTSICSFSLGKSAVVDFCFKNSLGVPAAAIHHTYLLWDQYRGYSQKQASCPYRVLQQ